MAGYLALIGYDVNLYNRTLKKHTAINGKTRNRINRGEIEGSGKLKLATNNIEEAIRGGTKIIMITVPAMGAF